MTRQNIISVSWGDQLVFGEGDGRLASPGALRRRMERWREDLGADTLHWREERTTLQGHFYAARGYRHPYTNPTRKIEWDDFEVVPHLAHEVGLKAYLYVSLFDEGWPLPQKKKREVSYHNVMHAQHTCWQSKFSREHPEYTIIDRSGQRRQHGVICLAYPEVRHHFRERFMKLLDGYEFDGLFVCLRSQSRPADFGDQFGFNEPVHQDYLARYGRDILHQDFDLQTWRDLLGEYLTIFLSELLESLRSEGLRLAVGAARGDILGPPLGNTTLQWRRWAKKGLIDDLIINQNSSKCPSMWHQLWPMHRGYGYLQNYLDDYNMPALLDQVDSTYAPAFENSPVRLFVSHLWDERSEAEEAERIAHPVITGLVYGSFRFDNPGPVARGNWRA